MYIRFLQQMHATRNSTSSQCTCPNLSSGFHGSQSKNTLRQTANTKALVPPFLQSLLMQLQSVPTKASETCLLWPERKKNTLKATSFILLNGALFGDCSGSVQPRQVAAWCQWSKSLCTHDAMMCLSGNLFAHARPGILYRLCTQRVGSLATLSHITSGKLKPDPPQMSQLTAQAFGPTKSGAPASSCTHVFRCWWTYRSLNKKL